MKITRIRLYLVNVPETHWWWSDDTYGQPQHQRDTHGVALVETSEGLTGLTQIERGTTPVTMRDALARWLGSDLLQTNLREPRPVMQASYEQAVLDIRGQALGVPIWQLLGGRVRDRIPVTQCTGYKTPGHTADDALRGWELGFRAYKMKCITAAEDTPEARIRYVTDRVEATHRAVPEMLVRPDLRWRPEEVWVARELATRLDGLPVDCLESPITREAAAGTFSEWRRLRDSISIPIGDHIGAADLPRAFAAGAMDYAVVGEAGHLATLDASRLADQLGMGGWSQTVAYGPGAAMGLHVAACMPNLSQAYDMVGPMAWEHNLVNEPFGFCDGCFEVPDRPGLGFTLDLDAVARYRVDEITVE